MQVHDQSAKTMSEFKLTIPTLWPNAVTSTFKISDSRSESKDVKDAKRLKFPHTAEPPEPVRQIRRFFVPKRTDGSIVFAETQPAPFVDPEFCFHDFYRFLAQFFSAKDGLSFAVEKKLNNFTFNQFLRLALEPCPEKNKQ